MYVLIIIVILMILIFTFSSIKKEHFRCEIYPKNDSVIDRTHYNPINEMPNKLFQKILNIISDAFTTKDLLPYCKKKNKTLSEKIKGNSWSPFPRYISHSKINDKSNDNWFYQDRFLIKKNNNIKFPNNIYNLQKKIIVYINTLIQKSFPNENIKKNKFKITEYCPISKCKHKNTRIIYKWISTIQRKNKSYSFQIKNTFIINKNRKQKLIMKIIGNPNIDVLISNGIRIYGNYNPKQYKEFNKEFINSKIDINHPLYPIKNYSHFSKNDSQLIDLSFRCLNQKYLTKEMCESLIDENRRPKEKGIWDRPCINNNDCPFYNKINSFGKCKEDGFCEMPKKVKQISYRKYI